MSGLPPELVERIHQETVENDGLYRQRSTECLDLSKVHYCQTEMINWAIQRLGNLNGARILDIGIGDGITSVLMALAGAHVTGIEVSTVALSRAGTLARRYGVKLDLMEMPGEELRFQDEVSMEFFAFPLITTWTKNARRVNLHGFCGPADVLR